MITEVKDKLLEYARVHFGGRSPNEAMAMKHMKERALLDQILPPKVKVPPPPPPPLFLLPAHICY